MPPPSQMKMQCSALPLRSDAAVSAALALKAAAASAPPVVVRNWRRFIIFQCVDLRHPHKLRDVDDGPNEVFKCLAPRGHEARVGRVAGAGATLHFDFDCGG